MLATACNLACRYCIARDLRRTKMSAELAHRAVEMFIFLAEGAKSIEITFTGGEPLIQFSLIKALASHIDRAARRANMESRLVVKTNGTILNLEIISFLRRSRARVVVSIDGSPDVHDQYRRSSRGEGTYEVVARNIRLMLENAVDCTASLTVHPQWSDSVLSNVQHLHTLGLRSIDVGPAYGTVDWDERQAEALARSLTAVASYMHRVNRKAIQLEVGPLYRESEHVAGQLRNCWGCRAASSNIAILPDGRVTGCSALAMLVPAFPELVIGSVSKGLDPRAVARVCKLAQAGSDRRSACRSCLAKTNCTVSVRLRPSRQSPK
jgi:uncharacterized protein